MWCIKYDNYNYHLLVSTLCHVMSIVLIVLIVMLKPRLRSGSMVSEITKKVIYILLRDLLT
jgi:hypothetical protein